MKIQDFRSLQPKAQEDLRRKSVKAVLGGRTPQEVGELLGVSGKSVGVSGNNYLSDGAKSLKTIDVEDRKEGEAFCRGRRHRSRRQLQIKTQTN